MKCKEHPRYKATRKPKSNCFACWNMWFKSHRKEPISGNDLVDMVGRIDKGRKDLEKRQEQLQNEAKQLGKVISSVLYKMDNHLVC